MAPEWIWEALNDETALELGHLTVSPSISSCYRTPPRMCSAMD